MNDHNGVAETDDANWQVIECQGLIGKDCFGRVFFDACESEKQHLINPKKEAGEERLNCRHYIDDLVPENLIGKEARVTVSFRYTITENK